jgi:uncharacterized ferritin-like protein (DUF455 family)
MLYEFPTCTPGSVNELVWRLLIRSTYQEGLALDDLAFEIRKRRFLGQLELAQAFNYLLIDEIFHVDNALKWSRSLCQQVGLDPMRERNRARDYFISTENHGRLQFIVRNPQGAIAEAEHLQRVQQGYDLPFGIELQVHLRRQAGFSDAEIQQVIDWNVYG